LATLIGDDVATSTPTRQRSQHAQDKVVVVAGVGAGLEHGIAVRTAGRT
jgi:hypothetical protein